MGKMLGIENKQKRHRAPKHILLGLKSEKPENQVPFFDKSEKHLKFAHKISVQNGCDTFPNELMRFHIEAKPIRDKFENAVNMQSSVKYGSDLLCRK